MEAVGEQGDDARAEGKGENKMASAGPEIAAAGPETANGGRKAADGPDAAPITISIDEEDDFVMYSPIDTSPTKVIGKDKAPITDPTDQLRDESSKAGIPSAAQGSSLTQGILDVKTTDDNPHASAPSSRPSSH